MSEYPWYIWATFIALINGVAIPICIGLVTADWRWLIVSWSCGFILYLWLGRR